VVMTSFVTAVVPRIKQNLLKMAFERGENLQPNSISEF